MVIINWLLKTSLGHSTHANATSQLAAVINPKVVGEGLGHSSVTITLDTYSHVLPNMQDELAIAVENLLKRS
jgi:integrase